MNCIIILGLCFAISTFGLVLSKPTSQNSSKHLLHKRDLFVSTGWGGAGLPFSTFYITGKQMKEIQSEANNENKKSNHDQNPEIISLVQCEDCAKEVTSSQEKQKTYTQTVPQLFSSNGWGPLG